MPGACLKLHFLKSGVLAETENDLRCKSGLRSDNWA